MPLVCSISQHSLAARSLSSNVLIGRVSEMGSELAARAVRLLEERGRATSVELARHVFGGESLLPLLEGLDHPRLIRQGDVWRLRQPEERWATLEILATGPN